MKRLCLSVVGFLAACSHHNNVWLGYAEGDYLFVSAPQAGWVTHVGVNRGDWVKKGTPLFSLDDTSQIAANASAKAELALAQGQMAQVQANLDFARKTLTRQTNLAHVDANSKENFDQAKSNYLTSKAQEKQIKAQEDEARAGLTIARYQLSQRHVTSAAVGQIQDVYFHVGEYVPAMTPVISILPPDNVYVRFFVPEDQFSKIHLGQKVKIGCDGCVRDLVATISFIASQEEFTPPVIFSLASRKKLVFKVEARASNGLKLNPGQPIDVRPLL